MRRYKDHFEDTWGIYLGVFALLLFIAAIFWVVVDQSRQRQELYGRYMNICVEDARKADPTMSEADAFERCDVQWEMGRMNAEDSKDTTVVPVIITN